MVTFGALAAVLLGALQAAGTSAQAPKQIEESRAKEILAQCGERSFQTRIAFEKDGKGRRATIRLCAEPTDSDAQWIAKLEKAAQQIDASPDLPAEAKARATAELQAAIAKARGGGVTPLLAIENVAPKAPSMVLPKGRSAEPKSDWAVAALPPMPAPVKTVVRPPSAVVAALPPAQLPPVVRPRLSVFCPPPGEPGITTECTDFAPDTMVAIRADEDLARKISIRFVRDGEPVASLNLAKMKRRQTMHTRLPGPVCAGVVRARLEVQTVVNEAKTGTPQVAETLGPFNLRC